MLKKVLRWLEDNEALVLLIIFSLILRLPSLFEPYWYGDEGIYLTLGQAFRHGLIWYRDIHDNKPPLLYLLAALAGTVFWFRLLLTVWFGATIVVFYRLVQKLLPKNPAAGNWATFLLIVLTTIFEGNIANAEIFIVLPITLGILLALKPRPNFWLIGLLFSAGFLFKLPAVFDLLALGLWLIVSKKISFKNLVRLGLGLGLPIALTIVYYAAHGAFTPYVRSALLQNIGYLHTWGSSQSGLGLRFGVAVLLSLITFRSLPRLWFIWAMFGALLSARPYPHYLIQPAVPLAILLVMLFSHGKKWLKASTLSLILIAGLAFYQIRFWQYPIPTYYQNWFSYITGQRNQTDYWRWFDQRVPQTYLVAAYIRQTTQTNDRIFVWGDDPYLYALSGRLPVGRYTVAYHIADFNGFDETIAALDQKPPKLIVVMTDETIAFPQLTARLATNYVLAATIERAQIFVRIDGGQP